VKVNVKVPTAKMFMNIVLTKFFFVVITFLFFIVNTIIYSRDVISESQCKVTVDFGSFQQIFRFSLEVYTTTAAFLRLSFFYP
jgi:hypothetical protein